ncbi:MAG: hypothetical protein AMK69_17430 [Nitrospira bacterium SG8_3]|nr:MAG: hypothetical protein AMK69_17430 [Nitrospira bacterium SG8_3]
MVYAAWALSGLRLEDPKKVAALQKIVWCGNETIEPLCKATLNQSKRVKKEPAAFRIVVYQIQHGRRIE